MTDGAFTLPDFHRLTPDFTGPERLAVWLGLPVDMRREANAELAERLERWSRAEFAEAQLGDYCTAQEIADEIAAIWPECGKVAVGQQERPRAQTPTTCVSDLDTLRSIPSAEFVPLLTGHDINRSGFVLCPLHDERTSSLHVSSEDGRWYCFGCDQGGGVLEFYGALHGQTVPAGGREFAEFVREAAQALLAGDLAA